MEVTRSSSSPFYYALLTVAKAMLSYPPTTFFGSAWTNLVSSAYMDNMPLVNKIYVASDIKSHSM